MTDYDRFQIDAIHPPMPRRSHPINWTWVLLGVLTLAVAVGMAGLAMVRWF